MGETDSSGYRNRVVNLLYLTSERLVLWMNLCRQGRSQKDQKSEYLLFAAKKNILYGKIPVLA